MVVAEPQGSSTASTICQPDETGSQMISSGQDAAVDDPKMLVGTEAAEDMNDKYPEARLEESNGTLQGGDKQETPVIAVRRRTKDFGFLPIPQWRQYDPARPFKFSMWLNYVFAFVSLSALSRILAVRTDKFLRRQLLQCAMNDPVSGFIVAD